MLAAFRARTHIVARLQDDLFTTINDTVLRLEVSISLADGATSFIWKKGDADVMRGLVHFDSEKPSLLPGLTWTLMLVPKEQVTGSSFDSASIHASLRKWVRLYPVPEDSVTLRVEGTVIPLGDKPFSNIGTAIYRTMKPFKPTAKQKREVWKQMLEASRTRKPAGPPWRICVITDEPKHEVRYEWIRTFDGQIGMVIVIKITGYDELTWTATGTDSRGVKQPSATYNTSADTDEILDLTFKWLEQNPVDLKRIESRHRTHDEDKSTIHGEPDLQGAAEIVGTFVVAMAQALAPRFAPDGYYDKILIRERAEREKQAEIARRVAETAELRKQREAEKEKARIAALERMEKERIERERKVAAIPQVALVEAGIRVEMSPLSFQDSALPVSSLKKFLLLERAAQWWVSNQTDDLLCLPSCRIERLEYQVRTALRVLGPLRGRALLSDEVGLGKTIEAGLVCKELLTRGMVRRLLILTMPSLVDQWAEELREKFDIESVTTNQSLAKSNPERFWRENNIIVASLHTAKQAAHLAIARSIEWDALVVDEAHHLRNRDSLAWQAVNSLPRQFLLLLSATPVQNSIEELYNLVTLLQPGQLPTPKEFRARFIDPERPRQPREPEELRRLLGQVMIRNTRANAGIKLPSRHAETALFEPTAEEEKWRIEWEADLRTKLAALPASQMSLWGRLLLQAAGSSPAAWRSALEKFPDKKAAAAWSKTAPLETSWKRKCALLPPLATGDGGCVIFSQFLDTQAALADFLRGEGVKTFVINGSTPAAERQPITEHFREEGGALLLSSSGAEGRNLQFCHRLINFDLPWNPMEIEQRIGRLHRLGQTRVVRIYNIVQRGTLQEHLLDVLQEKLNLFELVVGETGMVLGEKFSSDEFAEEVLNRWRGAEDDVAGAFQTLGEELAAARAAYGEVQRLDATLFAQDYDTQ